MFESVFAVRRRDFIASSSMLMISGALATAVSAQPYSRRAAIVIGVNKCRNLPVLSAAASGARQVGKWLMAEGFDVQLLVDDSGPVTANQIFQAIEKIVEKGTYEQLVVYFSGHGFIESYSEFWLLSNAPHNPNEAVNLIGSSELARDVGIPHVVFISDACRSKIDTIGASRVSGSLVFPGSSPSGRRADVDKFFAALPGKPALELPVDKSTEQFEGLYTSCLLGAYRKPYPSMVTTLADGTRVVPNRSLREYLEKEVQRKAQKNNIRLNQIPDAEIMSGSEAYIGTVLGNDTKSISITPQLEPSIFDIAITQLTNVEANYLSARVSPASEELQMAFRDTGYESLQQQLDVYYDPTSASPLLGTGFVVTGAEIKDVKTSPKYKSSFREEGQLTKIDVDVQNDRSCSVAVAFEDGSGTVLAAMNDFVGIVTLDANGIVSVDYQPSAKNWRRPENEASGRQLASLRAAIATSAQFGVFRIEGKQDERQTNARKLVDQIRVLKGVDPTLSMYAAYAFLQAGADEQNQSIYDFMKNDLGISFFDIAMLANRISGEISAASDVSLAPFCPMLSQGWNLLSAKNVKLAKGLEELQHLRRESLWTLFEPKGTKLVFEGLSSAKVR